MSLLRQDGQRSLRLRPRADISVLDVSTRSRTIHKDHIPVLCVPEYMYNPANCRFPWRHKLTNSARCCATRDWLTHVAKRQINRQTDHASRGVKKWAGYGWWEWWIDRRRKARRRRRKRTTRTIKGKEQKVVVVEEEKEHKPEEQKNKKEEKQKKNKEKNTEKKIKRKIRRKTRRRRTTTTTTTTTKNYKIKK